MAVSYKELGLAYLVVIPVGILWKGKKQDK